MEASQVLQRRLLLSLTRSFQHQCSLSPARQAVKSQAPPHTQTRPPRQLPPSSSPSSPSSSKAFSTCRRWHQDGLPSSQRRTDGTSPAPIETPKQALRSYISGVQSIIDGYKLKDHMASRQHEQFIVALTNAEVALDAPRQTPDSFRPLLQSLQGEINPILQRQFGTTDIQSLRTKATSRPASTPSTPPSSQPTPPPEPKRSISEDLDFAFPPRQRRPSPTSRAQSMQDAFPDSTLSKLDSAYSNLTSARSAVFDIYRSTPPPTQKPTERMSQIERKMNLDSQLRGSDAAFFANSLTSDPTRESLHLKPSLGRTVAVNYGYGSDLTRAFRSLEGLCARNRVRADQIVQRFHVRRGQKKKNLKISRWRKQFMTGFLAECGRVRRMRKQGW